MLPTHLERSPPQQDNSRFPWSWMNTPTAARSPTAIGGAVLEGGQGSFGGMQGASNTGPIGQAWLDVSDLRGL
jgi:hypothetical protein